MIYNLTQNSRRILFGWKWSLFLVFIINISTNQPFCIRGLFHGAHMLVCREGLDACDLSPIPRWAQIGHYLHSTLLGVTHNLLPISPPPKILPPPHSLPTFISFPANKSVVSHG